MFSVEWKMINGYPGIKDDRYMISNYGDVLCIKTKNILQKFMTNKGYLVTTICGKFVSIHKLVATFYVPGRSAEKNEVDHIDGNKLNNYYENLEWVTHQENMRRAYVKGLIKPMVGEDNPKSSIPKSSVEIICELLIRYNGRVQAVYEECIKRDIKTSKQMIMQIKHKKSWTQISDQYFNSEKFKPNHPTDEMIEEICKLLVEYNGKAKMVYNKIIEKYPRITYQYIQSIKMKIIRPDISDKYFSSFIKETSVD